MNNPLGERIISERERLGIPQGDVLTWTGVSRSTQFAYERGERSPDAAYLLALMQHGFDVIYLLTGERPPRYGSADEALLCDVIIAIESALATAGHTADVETRAKLIAFAYHTSAENGHVDPVVVRKLMALL